MSWSLQGRSKQLFTFVILYFLVTPDQELCGHDGGISVSVERSDYLWLIQGDLYDSVQMRRVQG